MRERSCEIAPGGEMLRQLHSVVDGMGAVSGLETERQPPVEPRTTGRRELIVERLAVQAVGEGIPLAERAVGPFDKASIRKEPRAPRQPGQLMLDLVVRRLHHRSD